MTTWSKEQLEQKLQEKGWDYTTREIQRGMQYVLSDGTPIDWYETGKVVVRGKASDIKQEAEKLFSSQQKQRSTKATGVVQTKTSPKRVFVVYGHDANAREQLELILRRLKLEPIVIQNLPSDGETLIEKLESLTSADFACVLLTPDDEGHKFGKVKEKKPRARQNVVLELGMVLSKLGRKRVAILVKGNGLERPSDIDGLIYLPFKDRVEEAKNHLAANLQNAGFDIQVEDLIS